MSRRYYALVTSGREKGIRLYPHRYQDGSYVVSRTRFERDYIRIASVDEIGSYLDKGYSLRMSNPDSEYHRSPSLIAPSSILIDGDGD